MDAVFGNGLREGEYRLDHTTMDTCYKFYHSDPVVRAAVATINEAITGGEIVFVRGGKPQNLTNAFKGIVEKFWRPLGIKIITLIHCFGLVPIKIVKSHFGKYFAWSWVAH